ncbi:tetratricopeptide repeat protein [uncultured Flavobacterium sp.]|uniref:TIR domain-containing protein n=1 Tax=uncultured Flavobacterium sp. TaxID=165435 RepID=UPI003081629C
MSNPKINVFISYSHDDSDYFKVFSQGLKKVIKNTEHFDWNIWDDTNIHVGTFWDEEIQNNIQNCNVAILLVSIGFMSSKYIKEKEFEEFNKRYVDKGILIVPIVFKPCDFNRWEDLSKIQFFKPDGKIYGKSEIENFTYSDLIKFKETDGTIIPNPNIDRYHLALVKKIEESLLFFFQKIKKTEIDISTNNSTSNVNILADYPKPSKLFTGREKEIEELKEAFNSHRIFGVQGLGGTGKTQLTAKFIHDNIPDKSRIVWLNGSSQSNFDVFVQNAGYGEILKTEKETNLSLYSSLKDLIEKDERIIFFDNYNDYEDNSFAEFLNFAYQYLTKATIVLITKTEPSIEKVTLLQLIRLEGLKNDALDYAKKIKQSNSVYSTISDFDLEIVCKGVDGHPLAIEFSMWLMSRGKSANDILSNISGISSSKKAEEFSKRLFLDIFNHPKTTDEEREFFLKCSIFNEKITINEITSLFEDVDIFYFLDSLMDKLLITHRDGYYEIHPLVRSFSYEKLQNKQPVHKKAANYLINLRKEILNASLEEKIFYHLSAAKEWNVIADYIEKEGRSFIKQGQLGLLTEFLNKLNHLNISRPIFDILNGDISQIRCEWDNALLFFTKAQENNTENTIIAEGIIKCGEILFRKGETKNSLVIFEKAYEFAKERNLRKEEGRALNDIGLINTDFNKLDIALINLTKALKIRKEVNDLEGITSTNNNIANIFDRKHQYRKSLKIHLENIEIATNYGDKISLALYLTNAGNSLFKLKEIDEALLKINLALKINEEIGDKAGIITCLNIIGLIFNFQNRKEEALVMFNQSIKISKEIGNLRGLASAYNNIGSFYLDNSDHTESLLNFFKSLCLWRGTGNTADEKLVLDWITEISKKIGKDNFKILANQVYEKLDQEYQKGIEIKEFFNEPIKRELPKQRNNDLCNCGSGIKYKRCCKK